MSLLTPDRVFIMYSTLSLTQGQCAICTFFVRLLVRVILLGLTPASLETSQLVGVFCYYLRVQYLVGYLTSESTYPFRDYIARVSILIVKSNIPRGIISIFE